MLKVIMCFILLLVMAEFVAAESARAVPQAAVSPSNPTVELLSACYGPNGYSALNVRQWSSADARLKYEAIEGLFARTQGGNAAASANAAAERVSPPIPDVPSGITGFDGSSITWNAPPAANGPDVEPLRVTAVSGNMTGGQSSPVVVPQPSHAVMVPAWANLGAHPVRQNQPMAHYRIEGTNLVRPTGRNGVQSSSTPSSSQTRHVGASFTHSHR